MSKATPGPIFQEQKTGFAGGQMVYIISNSARAAQVLGRSIWPRPAWVALRQRAPHHRPAFAGWGASQVGMTDNFLVQYRLEQPAIEARITNSAFHVTPGSGPIFLINGCQRMTIFPTTWENPISHADERSSSKPLITLDFCYTSALLIALDAVPPTPRTLHFVAGQNRRGSQKPIFTGLDPSRGVASFARLERSEYLALAAYG